MAALVAALSGAAQAHVHRGDRVKGAQRVEHVLEGADLVGCIGEQAGARTRVAGRPGEFREDTDRDQRRTLGGSGKRTPRSRGNPGHVGAVKALGRVGAEGAGPFPVLEDLTVRAVPAQKRVSRGEAGLVHHLAGEVGVARVDSGIDHHNGLPRSVAAPHGRLVGLDQGHAHVQARAVKPVFLHRDHTGTPPQPRQCLGSHLERGEADAAKAPGRPVRRPSQLRSQLVLYRGDSLTLQQAGSACLQAALGKRWHVELNDDADDPLSRGTAGELRRDPQPPMRFRYSRRDKRDQRCRDQTAEAPEPSRRHSSSSPAGARNRLSGNPGGRPFSYQKCRVRGIGALRGPKGDRFPVPSVRCANQAGAEQGFPEP
jgi:hypothetical protein